MNIKLSSELRDELLNMCRKNRIEVGGYILGYIKDGDYHAQEIEPYRKDVIAHSSKGHLSFNKNYIHDTIFRLRQMKNGGVYVRFHTHPTSKISAVMSSSDEILLSRIQILAAKLCKHAEITVCEGIVSASEIIFYTYDLLRKKAIRLPLFIDEQQCFPISDLEILKSIKKKFVMSKKADSHKTTD